ncbi:putative g-protein coupled receptor 21 [Gigaspora margarita]|uniref:Putative g-protein coupled receptor 21 n=1 Tax=Gigaspora margarita TaxID=4874 RepID=A0A8H3X7J0_GIGMA|nr:putative g-protein coupled receptor 21 [Gigaspora margarita]
MNNMSNIYSGKNLRELPGYDLILTSGFVAGVPNFICIIYILARNLTRWWVTEGSLPMAHRAYSAIHGETLQGVGCKIVGGITFFCVATNMALVGLLSLTTYLRICKKYFFNMGIYDYKFFSIILLISLTLTLIGVKDYGPNKFWCYSAPNDPITPLITTAMIFLIMIVTFFCYIMTLFEVNIQQNKIRKLGSDSVSFSRRLELIIARKIIGYILIFIIEWTPTMIYFIAQMLQYDNMWIYTAAVVAINFGGVGNAIVYIIYENWTNKYDTSLKSEDSRKTSEGSNNTLVANSNSGTFKNNQDSDSYPQIKVHNSVAIEKEINTFNSSNLDISNQE